MKPALVIDNGTGMIKAGFGDEEHGRNQPTVFPNFVGRPKHYRVMPGGFTSNTLVGNDAMNHRGILKLNRPMSHGIITDWDDMERVWKYTYKLLKVKNRAEHPVLLTEAPKNPPANRGHAAEIFFERLSCPALYVQIASLLSLYATGRTNGLVLDSGDGVTSAVPIYEGFALTHAIERSNVAGRDITEYLIRLLRKAGNKFVSSAEQEVVDRIKIKTCYVVYNVEKTENETVEDEPEVPFTLPDGTSIEVGTEQYRAPEVLFNPSIIGKEELGIHQVLVNALLKSDKKLRRKLSPNIRLNGGSTMFSGLGDRLVSEVRRLLFRDNTKIKIQAFRQKRKIAAWIGGSILASLSMFQKMLIKRQEWDESGMQVVYRKTY